MVLDPEEHHAPARRARCAASPSAAAAWWPAARGRATGRGARRCTAAWVARGGRGRARPGPASETARRREPCARRRRHWERRRGAPPRSPGDDGRVRARADRGRRAGSCCVADASPLQNRLLDEADNAALALGLAGPGPVVFVESVHGYGDRPPASRAARPLRLGADPARLSGAAADRRPLAAHRARPSRRGAALPAARARYVDALAADAGPHARPHGGGRAVRAAARERLARRAALARATRTTRHGSTRPRARSGSTDDEARRCSTSDDDGIAAGRALARLSGGRERTRA